MAANTTRTGRIAVIGTPATMASEAYPSAIARYLPDAAIACQACPLFVPLAEEGWTEGPVPRQVAETYLDFAAKHDADTLVLGCTHYPLLRDTITAVAGPSVTLVDSAESTAEVVAEVLEAQGLALESLEAPEHTFLATDSVEAFHAMGARFLGKPLQAVEWVDIA